MKAASQATHGESKAPCIAPSPSMVRELSGEALEWAVTFSEIQRMRADGEHVKEWLAEEVERGQRADAYLSDWIYAGELLDRYEIELTRTGQARWQATIDLDEGDAQCVTAEGESQMEAIARCAAVYGLGETVEVPQVLT